MLSKIFVLMTSSCTVSMTTTSKKMATNSRYDKLQARYNLLTSKAASGESFLPDTAYANFLKTHDYQSLPNVVPDSSGSPPRGSGWGLDRPRPQSANTIRKRAEASLDASNKRLKAIEDHMWSHRQEERELKRAEMEIVKQKKQLQRVMKSYESSMTRKHAEETQALLGKEAELTQYTQRDQHLTKEAGKERTQVALAGRQKLNEVTKKYIKTENELSWRYQNLVQALDRKRSEVEQLSHDFEARLRAKEEEQYKLKQELAKLAITLNMEANKYRQGVAEGEREEHRGTRQHIQETNVRGENMAREERSKVMAGKRYEATRRELDHSLKSKQESQAAKERQSGRQLLDVRSKLQRNAENKYFTSQEAEHVQLEMLGLQSQNKVEMVEARRRTQSEQVQERRRERNRQEVEDWTARFSVRENEQKRRQHEERLKKLATLVSHHDSAEHDLYSQAKSAESQRKKQAQVVVDMNRDLEALKQTNARRLKEAALQAQKAEAELKQKILRENAELAKSVNIREERLRHLSLHRQRAKEDRHLYREEKKEKDRRTRIDNRTALQTV